MFSNETFEVILQRKLDTLPSDVDKRQGSIAYDLLAASTIEDAIDKVDKQNILKWAFIGSDMPSDLLELRVGELGIYRKEGVKATGQVSFIGLDGVVVTKGFRVATPIGTTFETLEDVTVKGGIAAVNIRAIDVGISGNVTPSAISVLVDTIVGIEGVINLSSTTGGIDVETDEALIDRYLLTVRNPATSGNSAHYIQWAMSVDGVGAAFVTPVHNGAGTVLVTIADSNKRTPSVDLLDKVEAYISTVQPIGVDLTVDGAVEVAININVDVVLANGKSLAEAKEEITNVVSQYLYDNVFVDSTIRYTRIGSLILSCNSVADYNSLTINGGTTNVQLTSTQIPRIGTVTVV